MNEAGVNEAGYDGIEGDREEVNSAPVVREKIGIDQAEAEEVDELDMLRHEAVETERRRSVWPPSPYARESKKIPQRPLSLGQRYGPNVSLSPDFSDTESSFDTTVTPSASPQTDPNDTSYNPSLVPSSNSDRCFRSARPVKLSRSSSAQAEADKDITRKAYRNANRTPYLSVHSLKTRLTQTPSAYSPSIDNSSASDGSEEENIAPSLLFHDMTARTIDPETDGDTDRTISDVQLTNGDLVQKLITPSVYLNNVVLPIDLTSHRPKAAPAATKAASEKPIRTRQTQFRKGRNLTGPPAAYRRGRLVHAAAATAELGEDIELYSDNDVDGWLSLEENMPGGLNHPASQPGRTDVLGEHFEKSSAPKAVATDAKAQLRGVQAKKWNRKVKARDVQMELDTIEETGEEGSNGGEWESGSPHRTCNEPTGCASVSMLDMDGFFGDGGALGFTIWRDDY